MPDEDLKKFSKNINKHFPRGSDDRFRFAHLGKDPNATAPAAPAPSPGPAAPVESVQGASENTFTEDATIGELLERKHMSELDKNADKILEMLGEIIRVKENEDLAVRSVPEMLMEAAETYKQRQAIYGYNYLQFGHVMMALFPNGITIEDIDTWNRLGIFVQMITKVTRYASQMGEGGHDDSLLDLSVYSQMLREVDAMLKAKK